MHSSSVQQYPHSTITIIISPAATAIAFHHGYATAIGMYSAPSPVIL